MDDWTYPYPDVDVPDTQPLLLNEDGRVMEARRVSAQQFESARVAELDPSVAHELADLLELGPIAEHLMADWATQRKGRALWCVGKQIYKVQTVLHPAAAAFTYTNQAIDGAR